MKKNLRLFLVAALAMVFGTVMAETSTLTFTAKCNGAGTANDGTVWTITSDGTESNFDSNKGIHYGTGSAAVQYIKLSTSAILGTITKVVVNASAASGVTASVDVTVGGAAFGGDAQSLSTTATDYSFTGSAAGEIVVNVSKPSSATKALYVKSVEVTYTPAAGTVSAPKFSVEQGMYFESQQVELTCSTEGADIFYTTNGDDPTASSTKYIAPITVSANMTIKAVAIKGSNASSVVSASYTIVQTTGKGTAESPFSIADAMLVINALADNATTSSAVYTKGIVVGDVTVNSGQAQFKIGATASATDNLITVYKAKGLENENYVAGDTKAGDEVVICAPLQKYVREAVTTPETQYGYIYSINGETSKATPTLDGDGSETNPFTVNDLKVMKKSQRPAEAAWVKGTIVGSASSATVLATEDVTSNIALGTAEAFIPVQLANNTVFRTKLNVKDNAGNKGQEVYVKGTITDYFQVTGVTNLVEAKIGSEVITGIASVKANAKFDGKMYNTAGQLVNKGYKGLIIMNGRKFVNK